MDYLKCVEDIKKSRQYHRDSQNDLFQRAYCGKGRKFAI
jgi:hypothetical protein